MDKQAIEMEIKSDGQEVIDQLNFKESRLEVFF